MCGTGKNILDESRLLSKFYFKKMIIRIEIKNVASYDKEGVVFDNLQKVNFIFGGNGTGKTTLSRFLAGPENMTGFRSDGPKHGVGFIKNGVAESISFDKNGIRIKEKAIKKKRIEQRDFSVFKNCKIEWIGRHNEIMVFNQDFKIRNLTEVMPGVFSIGPEVSKDRINKDSYSVQPAIDFINETLNRIGFSGFRIRKSTDNPYSYVIVRKNGEYASETLSEGEVTIITFLYYLQLVEGIGSRNNPYGQKITIIDDPISSLDYDTIEVVSTLTNRLIDSARRNGSVEQVIILTHNTTFHQSLSVRQPKEETNYWKLYKKKGVSKVTDYGAENPVAGDYERLWMKLRKGVDVMDMPNLMRKIIETYFVDYGGYNKRKLLSGAYVMKQADKQTVESLGKWIDEGSHGVKDNLFSGNEDVIYERSMEAFRLLFETMGQGEHYKMMMRL